MSTRTKDHNSTNTGGIMDTTTKISGGIAALTIAGLALTGCSFLEGEEKKDEGPKALAVEGSFVYAPVAAPEAEETEGPEEPTMGGDVAEVDLEAKAAELGELYTLTVTKGEKGGPGTVEVVRSFCKVDASDPKKPTSEASVDARETAFGELGEATDDTKAPLTWLEPGKFGELAGGKDKAAVEVLSGGTILRVGDANFFSADGAQGGELADQFTEGCSDLTKPVSEPAETEDPSKTESPAPGGEPTDPAADTAAEGK